MIGVAITLFDSVNKNLNILASVVDTKTKTTSVVQLRCGIVLTFRYRVCGSRYTVAACLGSL